MSKLFLIPCAIAEGTEQHFLNEEIKSALTSTQVFFAENLRTARRFISACKLEIDIESLHIELLDKDTSVQQVNQYFDKYKGQSIGVISEAGCPGVADPGAVAVQVAHQRGIEVIPLVGPSSLLLTLMASGLNGQKFTFHGYLAIEKQDRISDLRKLEQLALRSESQLFIETPYRNNKMFEDIVANLSNDITLCVGCNVGAEDGFVLSKKIKEWKKVKLDLHKKPTVFILG